MTEHSSEPGQPAPQWQSETLRRLQTSDDVEPEQPDHPSAPEHADQHDAVTGTTTDDDPSTIVEGEPRRAYHQLSKRPAAGVVSRTVARLRSVVAGDEQPTELVATWEKIQVPLATGRRVHVVAAHGGAGATTVALCLSHTLHRHRSDGVVLIENGDPRGGLSGRLAAEPSASVASLSVNPTGFALPEPGEDDALVVLAPGTADPEQAYRIATRLRRSHAITVTDGGPDLAAHAEDVDCVVVVAHNTVRGLAAAYAARQESIAGGVEEQRVLMVLVGSVPNSGLTLHRAMEHVLKNDVAAVSLGPDRHLAGAAAVDPELLGAGTVLDLARLAGRVVQIVAVPQ